MIRRAMRVAALVVCAVGASAACASGVWAAEAGDAASGKAIFLRTCQTCHSVDIGVNKIGPSLWNVVGRQAAAVPDYAYSEGMKVNKAIWTAASLDAYLADPRGDVHGAKMFFKGLARGEDRADVIAYLRTLK